MLGIRDLVKPPLRNKLCIVSIKCCQSWLAYTCVWQQCEYFTKFKLIDKCLKGLGNLTTHAYMNNWIVIPVDYDSCRLFTGAWVSAGFPQLIETLEKPGIYFSSSNPGNSLELCVKTLNPYLVLQSTGPF